MVHWFIVLLCSDSDDEPAPAPKAAAKKAEPKKTAKKGTYFLLLFVCIVLSNKNTQTILMTMRRQKLHHPALQTRK
jgi:hypothetical protein